MGSSYREKRDVEQVDFGFEELSHRCNDLENISGFPKEGGDNYFQVGEMPEAIVGIVCLKRMSCRRGVFKKFYPSERREKMNSILKYLRFIVSLALLMVFILPCVGYPQTKDKIRIGNAIALSGPYAPGAITTQIAPYDMWVKEVNAKGGIFVKKYGKKLPVEIIRYDDKSDIGTAVKLVEKLILDDKVDLLLPPWGTAMNFAIAPIVTKYEYPVMGVTVDSMKIKEIAPTIPYFFVTLEPASGEGGSHRTAFKRAGSQDGSGDPSRRLAWYRVCRLCGTPVERK